MPKLQRVILAGASNAGYYINNFIKLEQAQGGLGVLKSLLKEIWDFDSEVSRKKDAGGNWVADPDGNIGAHGVSKRAYYQMPRFNLPGDSTIIRAPASRWEPYFPAGAFPAVERPPLPPAPSNSSLPASSDTPRGGADHTHHMVRDFLFLDAMRSHDATQSNAVNVDLGVAHPTYTVSRIESLANPQGTLADYTHGTGTQSYEKKLLVTGAAEVMDDHTIFTIESGMVDYTALLYELNGADAAVISPNWFGVAVPRDLDNFSSAVIYFHPLPQQARYADGDYQNKNSSDPTRANWKELFGYVDRLGAQLAGAVRENPRCRQIVIFPFMKQGDATTAGILPKQWYFIVSDILSDVAALRMSGQL